MSTECYPIATLPHITRLYREYLAMGDSAATSPMRAWYGAEPLGRAWDRQPGLPPLMPRRWQPRSNARASPSAPVPQPLPTSPSFASAPEPSSPASR